MNKLKLELQPEQQVYFTSDLHFGHRNVINFCNRPFSDVKEMDRILVENYNSVVQNQDIVFILGDLFWFSDSRAIQKTLNKLAGKEIYILPGNHDDFQHYYRVVDPRIHLLSDVAVVWIGYPNKSLEEIWLSHYPMLTWPHRTKGKLQLFGHIHTGPNRINLKNSIDVPGKDLELRSGQQYDVGVDNNCYKPVSLAQINLLLKRNQL